MFERLKLLAKDKNPYFQHAMADYWIAYHDGEPVGRISAQIDELAQDGHGQGTGHFGFVEAPDDPAVFRALFETAEAWLQDRGMVRALGPFNLSINEECGLLIDGFEDRQRIMMSHARPYYAARIEGSEGNINALRAPSPRPRSQAITPPAPHPAAPLEPQAQRSPARRARPPAPRPPYSRSTRWRSRCRRSG